MRVAILSAACFLAIGSAGAQPPDPASEPVARAYEALRVRDYDAAIAGFRKGIEAAPGRASIRKDLAYTYLKIGESELARDQFREAMRLEPHDTQVALEYAFLCYETKQQAQARRVFDRLRQAGNSTAEQAFQNIDAPLAAGIERWKQAIAGGADNFSAHFELATLAEQRDEWELAAEHYEKAWHTLPDRRSVLVDLGRVWKSLNRLDAANAALLAASRGGEPRAAEMARELLPDRYPFVSEFRAALALDPANAELRRELGYLLLRMNRQADAEQEFRVLADTVPDDLLSATQLGFLRLARGDQAGAMPLFDRVMAGPDEDLANRVRAVLRIPQVLKPRADSKPVSIDAKVMAERSVKAGYMKDALKYLQIAHEAEPGDFHLMLQLGWTYNVLHQDDQAILWFDLARRSTDPQIASEAGRAWKNLHDASRRFVTTVWMYPLYSSRWSDLFSYGQIKTEWRSKLKIRPYVSTRFIGDSRGNIGEISPQYLSESSFIAGVGVATVPWHGITGWAEAGSAISYMTGHMLPDYRGGVSMARAFGARLVSDSSGWFAASDTDGVFVSRFGNDSLAYEQARFGYALGPRQLRAQLYWNGNLTVDAQQQAWANFGETGPGVRIHTAFMPPPVFLTVNVMQGMYLTTGARFTDLRLGMWYAFTH
ncbi:MAG TPA: tetratricopeptide repeat protein [Bryobacteraceae bacterium]|nr:tetratricopeptide repeat protein [Bryobacteraceae bacterium]